MLFRSDTLLDADLESDILGWQYISGSLPDGHELQRLDSPEVRWASFFNKALAIEFIKAIVLNFKTLKF